MDRLERFRLFLMRLGKALACSTASEALALITTVLNAVEDEFSGAPYNPMNWASDGRMYPPEDDFLCESGIPSVTRYRTKGHYVDLGSNGAIRISKRADNAVVFEKPGSDGGGVPRK
jgi:hypothetical protein